VTTSGVRDEHGLRPGHSRSIAEKCFCLRLLISKCAGQMGIPYWPILSATTLHFAAPVAAALYSR
jgi:hypothetical protein